MTNLLLAYFVAIAPSDSARLLIEKDLSTRTVELVTITPSRVIARDEAGVAIDSALADVLAILSLSAESSLPKNIRPWNAPPALSAGMDAASVSIAQPMIQLVSGAYIPGSLSPPPASPLPNFQPDHLPWLSPSLGLVQVPLENLHRAILRASPIPTNFFSIDVPQSDRALLSNADVAKGYCSTTTSTQGSLLFRIEPDAQGAEQPRELPADKVVALELANPAIVPAKTWLWLGDGTSMPVRELALQAERASFRALVAGEPAPTSVNSTEISTIVFDRERLVAMSSLPLMRVDDAPERRWTAPPLRAHALEDFMGVILLPGPMTCEWSLPARASHVAATITLAPDALVWGNCEVALFAVTASQAAPLWSGSLSGASPSHAIRARLPSGATSLRVQVREGAFGPVQDRVLIRSGLVAIEANPGG